MGIMLGYVCLVCVCLLMGKAATRKFCSGKPDEILKRMHKPVCSVLAAGSLLHIVLVLPIFWTRNIFVYITGLLVVLLLIVVIFFGHIRRTEHRKWRKQHIILSGLMLLCIIGHVAIYFMDFSDYQARIESINLHKIQVDSIADGQYVGEYDAGYIYAKVQVTVSNGAIQNIVLVEHKNEQGQTAENVISEIVDKQEFPVDAVSGATNSSCVIQKAVQNALEGMDFTRLM